MAVALIVAGGAVASWWLWRTAGLLPPRIETEELVEDLSLQLDPARLSAYFLVGDRARRALVAPPPIEGAPVGRARPAERDPAPRRHAARRPTRLLWG